MRTAFSMRWSSLWTTMTYNIRSSPSSSFSSVTRRRSRLGGPRYQEGTTRTIIEIYRRYCFFLFQFPVGTFWLIHKPSVVEPTLFFVDIPNSPLTAHYPWCDQFIKGSLKWVSEVLAGFWKFVIHFSYLFLISLWFSSCLVQSPQPFSIFYLPSLFFFTSFSRKNNSRSFAAHSYGRCGSVVASLLCRECGPVDRCGRRCTYLIPSPLLSVRGECGHCVEGWRIDHGEVFAAVIGRLKLALSDSRVLHRPGVAEISGMLWRVCSVAHWMSSVIDVMSLALLGIEVVKSLRWLLRWVMGWLMCEWSADSLVIMRLVRASLMTSLISFVMD